jgi:hypothetical protein
VSADDLEERVFVLREALRDLCRLEQMEADGVAYADMRDRWRKAWMAARDALNEEGGE